MNVSSPQNRAWLWLFSSGLALLMAVTGSLRLEKDHGGGEALSYFLEVGLPALLFVGCLWVGVSLWRRSDLPA